MSSDLQIVNVRLCGGTGGESRSDIAYDEGFTLEIKYEVRHPVSGASIGINLGSYDGTAIFASSDLDGNPERFGLRKPGRYTTNVRVPGRWLNTGRYILQAHATHANNHQIFDTAEPIAFNIVDTDSPGSFQVIKRRLGVLQPVLEWRVEGM